MPHTLQSTIISNAAAGAGHWEMTLSAEPIAREARPGQFVQVRCGHLPGDPMRRPLSVFRAEPRDGTISLAYLLRGPVTSAMSALRPGDSVSVVGPLGNGFTVVTGAGARHALVGGGIGAPPLYALAGHIVRTGLTPREVTVINGARLADLLVARSDFEALGVDLRITTDDGSAGRRGTVVDELRDLVNAVAGLTVYACGPTPMLRAVAEVCVAAAVECQVSVETVMACGLGVCMGCVVKRRNPDAEGGFDYVRSCYEGPVFRAEEIIWE